MLIGKLKLDRNLPYFLTLIIVSLPLLVATPAKGNPFTEDQTVCPRFSCDINGNCVEIKPPLPCQNNRGYQLLFNGKLVSGPETVNYTLQQAEENCRWNRANKPNISIECFYNGSPILSQNSGRPRDEIIAEINSIAQNIAWAKRQMNLPEYGPEQRNYIQSQISFWEARIQQLMQELNR